MTNLDNNSSKRMSVEQLKFYYENDPKEYSRTETDVVVSLVHLVERGVVEAFQTSTGEIVYQYALGDWKVT